MRWTRSCRKACGAVAYGQAVWYECRRFEVPEVLAASPNRNFKSKAALESKFGQRPLLSEVRKGNAAMVGELRNAGAGVPPTLGSTPGSRARGGRGLASPVPRGDLGVSRKRIAQGVPDRFGQPVVTMLVCFFVFANEAAGAASARHSLRPLFDEGHGFSQSSGAICAAAMRRRASLGRDC